MARQTQFIVQGFIAGRGTSLKAEQPMRCKTAEEAIRRVKNFAKSKLGVVAYSTSADAETGDYDETPTILFKAGRLPPAFEEQ